MDEDILERAENDVPGLAIVPTPIFKRQGSSVREHGQDILEGNAVFFRGSSGSCPRPTRTCRNVATPVATINDAHGRAPVTRAKRKSAGRGSDRPTEVGLCAALANLRLAGN
jgi:hypothetical protein